MKKIIIVLVLLSGCAASPCKKIPAGLEKRQCEWKRREDRDVALFVGAGMGSLVITPFIAGHVFGKGNAAKWIAPAFVGTWAIGMFGAVDAQYIHGPYPSKEREKSKARP